MADTPSFAAETYADTLLGSHPSRLVNVCLVLVTVGQVLLNLLLGTVLFSRRVRKRNVTLCNLLFVTMLSSVPPELLLYAGHAFDPDPSAGLCTTQAILKHGGDTLFTTASFSLIVDVLLESELVRLPVSQRVRLAILVALPYCCFTVFAVGTAIVATSHAGAVQHKDGTVYCTLTLATLDHAVDIFCSVVATLTLFIEVYSGIMFLRIRRVLPTMIRSRSCRCTSKSALDLGFLLRLTIFTFLQLFYYAVLVLNFNISSVATHVVTLMYNGLMPIIAFLAFGTTSDCLVVWKSWMLCRSGAEAPETDEPEPISARIALSPLPSMSPAVNEARSRGEELPVIDITRAA